MSLWGSDPEQDPALPLAELGTPVGGKAVERALGENTSRFGRVHKLKGVPAQLFGLEPGVLE